MENFGGETPAIDDRLLPDSYATVAKNTWVFSGNVEPTHAIIPLHTPAPGMLSWFRLPKGNPGVDNMVDSWWLEFPNQDVRVIRSPIAGQDDDGRYYWADGIYPKMMTGTDIETGNPPIRLGVSIPPIAPTVVPSGGTSTVNETRSYVYTWVTANGEEGPPSPPTTATGKLDDTWAIGMTAPGPDATAERNLVTTRIYRTIVSAQGVATYFFVAEVPIGTLAYNDTQTDATIANNEQLKSLYWTEPPADLQGLVSMPNGMVAGWRNNEVWFCEPYYPHAWPVTYVIGVPNKVVGLGVYNQSVIILTQGQPYAATGVDPSTMALAIIQPLEPCTSRNSIVNTPNGVLYSSPNGLISITPQGAQNLTLQRILKDDWDALLNLDSIAASIIMAGYYAYSLQTPGVFQNSTDGGDAFTAFQQDAFQQESHYGTEPGAYISLMDPRIGINILDPTPSEVQNVITDIFNGETMIMRDGVIYVVDIRKPTPYNQYLWRSKIWTLPYLQNLGAAKVYFINQPNAPGPQTIFRVYAGEVADLKRSGLPLRHEEPLTRSGGVFRLPSGYKALYYQFELEGYATINSIHVGGSPRDLRQV